MKPKRTRAKKTSADGRKIELAKIHMAAASLPVPLIVRGDDSMYRDMLWSVARVRSAKDLDEQGRAKVLEHLRALGWKDSKPHARQRATPKPQVSLIRHLWLKLGEAGQLQMPDETGLRAYVKKQSASYHPQKVGYDAPEMLPPRVAQRVIEHLKHWCRRTHTEF